uniref:Uncharacterized protein n=1 Tax=Ditylenchus dipsaci TaxID=166011 RepID=A0A915D036_9BILA
MLSALPACSPSNRDLLWKRKRRSSRKVRNGKLGKERPGTEEPWISRRHFIIMSMASSQQMDDQMCVSVWISHHQQSVNSLWPFILVASRVVAPGCGQALNHCSAA